MVGLTQFPKVLIKALTTSKRVHVMLLCRFALGCHAQWNFNPDDFYCSCGVRCQFPAESVRPCDFPAVAKSQTKSRNWPVKMDSIDKHTKKSCFQEEKGAFIWGEHSHGVEGVMNAWGPPVRRFTNQRVRAAIREAVAGYKKIKKLQRPVA